MLEMISNVFSQKTTPQCNNCFRNKAIKFDNIVIEENKANDKNIVFSNIIINNLLNISNKKDIDFHSKNVDNIDDNKIQRKKINTDKNDLLNSIYFIKNIKIFKKKKIKEILEKFKMEFFLNKVINKKKAFNKINVFNNIKIDKNIYLKKMNHALFQKKIHISNINKNDFQLLEDEKKTILPLDFKKNKNILFSYNNINEVNNLINRKNLLHLVTPKECLKSTIEPLILHDTKNSIEWKKFINHKIFLSISNKYNKAEIHLQPESLGSIYILINMKNNAIKLKFISQNDEVSDFLDEYVPFLRNALTKKGIKLKKFDILNSLKNKKLTGYKSFFDKNSSCLNNLKKKLNIYEKKIDLMKYQTIDVYI